MAPTATAAPEGATRERERAQRVPSGRGRRAVAFLIGFSVVLVGVEGVVRAVEDRLPEPRQYYSMRAQVLVDEMDALDVAGVRSDLVFVGNSMVGRGTVPSEYETGLASVEWAHNVALPAGQTPVVQRWLLEEVVPRLRPRRVVWGVSSIDFNGGRADATIGQYDSARATRRGALGAADRVLAKVAISRHREELRDPVALGSLVSGSSRAARHARLTEMAKWDLGYRTVSPERLERLRQRHLSYVRDRQLARFRVGSDEMVAFGATIEELRHRGIEVLVVVWPVHTGYVDAHPNGSEDFALWERVLREEAEALGVPVVDFGDRMPDEDFRDYEHLNVDAAARFSAMLASELRAMGW